jgi:hypothetical protein
MQVIDGGAARVVLARDEVLDHARLQRSRTKQGDQRHDVAEAVRLQAPYEILHAARFELEYRGGLAALQQLISGGVVHRQRAHDQRRFTAFGAQGIDVAHRPLDDGEGAQAEEVELDQPGGLDVILVELGDRGGAPLLAVERREVGEHGGRDDDAARVRAGVSGETFERPREVDELAHLGIGAVQPPQLLLLL